MIKKEIQDRLERVYDIFIGAFIYKKEELILDKKLNVYFRLPNIKKASEFDYKVLSYCSFYVATHHFDPQSEISNYFLNRINRYFKKQFSIADLQLIYQRIGCGANSQLGVRFIESGLDLNILGVPPKRTCSTKSKTQNCPEEGKHCIDEGIYLCDKCYENYLEKKQRSETHKYEGGWIIA